MLGMSLENGRSSQYRVSVLSLRELLTGDAGQLWASPHFRANIGSYFQMVERGQPIL